MAGNWTINVNGHVYGPYTLQELRGFVAEGRLAPYSLVAREGETTYAAAAQSEDLAPLFGPTAAKPASGEPARTDADGSGERSRYIIVADMKTRSITNIDKAVKTLGTVCSLSSQSWLMTTDKQINVLRDALMQQLGNRDTLCIVDATHNKAVWCNYDPQGESSIRQVWLSQI